MAALDLRGDVVFRAAYHMRRAAGRIPVQRDTLYNVVREFPAAGPGLPEASA